MLLEYRRQCSLLSRQQQTTMQSTHLVSIVEISCIVRVDKKHTAGKGRAGGGGRTTTARHSRTAENRFFKARTHAVAESVERCKMKTSTFIYLCSSYSADGSRRNRCVNILLRGKRYNDEEADRGAFIFYLFGPESQGGRAKPLHHSGTLI